ncbi:MAG: prepilin peptidase [Acidimicrobiales bacterium]
MNVDVVDSVASMPLMPVIALAFVVGLLVGSFANVVVYRSPRGLSVSKPRSFCPTCRHRLVWWENVPVASWVALRGRCRTCHERISVRYPLVEAGMGLAFALVAWARHGSVMTIPYCVLAATLVSILLIDIGELRSPLSVAASGTAIAVAMLAACAAPSGQWPVLIGGLAGTLAGVVGYSALRRLDPACRWRRGYGRSALIPAGCWLGALGFVPAVAGLGSFAVVFLLAASLDRYSKAGSDAGPISSPFTGTIRRVIGRPLIAAAAVGTGVGLLVFR